MNSIPKSNNSFLEGSNVAISTIAVIVVIVVILIIAAGAAYFFTTSNTTPTTSSSSAGLILYSADAYVNESTILENSFTSSTGIQVAPPKSGALRFSVRRSRRATQIT